MLQVWLKAVSARGYDRQNVVCGETSVAATLTVGGNNANPLEFILVCESSQEGAASAKADEVSQTFAIISSSWWFCFSDFEDTFSGLTGIS